MSRQTELTEALLEGYRRAGEEVGYWGTRFLQAVRRSGGLATAKRMLKPRSASQRKGLDALLEAGRPDLSLESTVLQSRFAGLFSPEELAEARRRLGIMEKEARHRKERREQLYPDELEPGKLYVEGARKQVRVNAFERDPRARLACLRHHGFRCAVCSVSFEERYGELGREFIHVHHLRPLALVAQEYTLDPVKDLAPVCPNCHAMLHRQPGRVLSIEELKSRLRGAV